MSVSIELFKGFEIVGWTGHWIVKKDGAQVTNDKGQRIWFTKKEAAKKFVRKGV